MWLTKITKITFEMPNYFWVGVGFVLLLEVVNTTISIGIHLYWWWLG